MLARIHYDTRSRLAHLRCPVTIAHSRVDEVVPFSHAETLFREAVGEKAFVEIPGGHNDSLMLRDARYAAYLRRLFAETADSG
jgi:fermentation-respiration switch protein FrsA (DUF1100 family)